MKFIHRGARTGASKENYPAFFADPPSVYELAQQQRVSPVNDTDTLFAGFWPEYDSVDEFAATVDRWRNEES